MNQKCSDAQCPSHLGTWETTNLNLPVANQLIRSVPHPFAVSSRMGGRPKPQPPPLSICQNLQVPHPFAVSSRMGGRPKPQPPPLSICQNLHVPHLFAVSSRMGGRPTHSTPKSFNSVLSLSAPTNRIAFIPTPAAAATFSALSSINKTRSAGRPRMSNARR